MDKYGLIRYQLKDQDRRPITVEMLGQHGIHTFDNDWQANTDVPLIIRHPASLPQAR